MTHTAVALGCVSAFCVLCAAGSVLCAVCALSIDLSISTHNHVGM
eukprot:COSAG06_NODE_16642_length_989_cov_1.021348_1_plen_44_part_10